MLMYIFASHCKGLNFDILNRQKTTPKTVAKINDNIVTSTVCSIALVKVGKVCTSMSKNFMGISYLSRIYSKALTLYIRITGLE